MMVPTRRGATNTTLAATQRHPWRSGMVTADCAWSRSRPELVVASGGTEGSAENSRVHLLEYDFGSQGLAHVAVLYFGFSATVPKQERHPIAR